jgi:hypothetical protein
MPAVVSWLWCREAEAGLGRVEPVASLLQPAVKALSKEHGRDMAARSAWRCRREDVVVKTWS